MITVNNFGLKLGFIIYAKSVPTFDWVLLLPGKGIFLGRSQEISLILRTFNILILPKNYIKKIIITIFLTKNNLVKKKKINKGWSG